MSLAKIVVSGRVIKAPEKRFTPNSNVAVAELAIAVESAPRPDGSVDSNPIKVIAWRELAERCSHEIHKGDLVVVDGRLQINSYTTAEGQRRREAEIEAAAVENLSVSVNTAAATTTIIDTDNAQLVSSAISGSSLNQGTGESLDSIFASEDEIPF